MSGRTDGTLWPRAFGWAVMSASGLLYGGPVWAWVGVFAGVVALLCGAVELWPGDDKPARRARVRAAAPRRRGRAGGRRCRARNPQWCRHPRCPDRAGHAVRGGLGGR